MDHKNHSSASCDNIDWSNSLVEITLQKQGYVNRKVLAEMHGLSQLEAGSLMREFIKKNFKKIKWQSSIGAYTHKHN